MKETNRLYINYEELNTSGPRNRLKENPYSQQPIDGPEPVGDSTGPSSSWAKTQLSALLWLHHIRTTQANK